MLREANAPGEVEVIVDYYNATEAAAFQADQRYPQTIANVAGQRLHIPIAEFLIYSLFYFKEHQSRMHPDIAAIAARIDRADADLSEWIQWDGNSLRVHDDFDSLDKTITRRIGDAVGLAVANRIHGLNDADWEFIPERPGVNGDKTLDWHIASDGVQHIELEAKARVIADSSMLTGLTGAYNDIKDKKAAAAHPDYHRNEALRYGAIVALDKNIGSIIHCRLVDPKGTPIKRNPKVTRLLNRLAWATDLIAIISRRSAFTVALNNRLAALERLDDPFILENVSLLKGDGTEMNLDAKKVSSYSPFFQTRSTVSNSSLGGLVTSYDKNHLMFLGLHEDWLSVLAQQDFTKILSMNFSPKTINTTVHCIMSRRQFKSAKLNIRLPSINISESEFVVKFNLPAVIHQSSAGMAIGLVKLPPES